MSDSVNSVNELPIIIDGKPYPDITKNPPQEIATTAFTLGILLGVFLGLLPVLHFKSFNLYIIALSLFHFLEYYITAKYNPGKVHNESFLLNNGVGYLAAHLAATIECFLECLFFPHLKSYTPLHKALAVVGGILVLIGQVARTLAMSTAAQSFSHVLKTKKEKDHVLVKSGLYKYLRHPSYFGFFWWALGTQLLLLNPISFVVFVGVLWRFFSKRIAVEEKYLINFFGKEYIVYKDSVSTWIPFIN
ncbi:hypothetical protein KAFR_0E03400 [Kazachstania africana CBS 2517]|uniref:Protein-S-isoprenylcysteine O-methyltransferase n=1 Tax=Kazachstania africana (strain ATCC 22294 / BCRC 22015 / CBS 2517 / CECT 1963 / NBRC 1671 / NRRL Y-8276) TaxID=1071382 RepID=H2AVU2_KAZAF|nr:hypothetical protein KAFR_0E03400 [Kazachstania africana CBS 2517]CCF58492.1 hypothetical protein KAFR_0E03400 [Kazachstania africana CBS 2517]